jgi:hypothetical protein
MTIDDKLWFFLIWSSLFILYLGYPKFALFYYSANEIFWEDEEEEDEIDQEENMYTENYDELDNTEIPYFFTPVYKYDYYSMLKIFRSYSCLKYYYK